MLQICLYPTSKLLELWYTKCILHVNILVMERKFAAVDHVHVCIVLFVDTYDIINTSKFISCLQF